MTYGLDSVGNRTSVVDGSTTSYTPNDLNQYTAVGAVSPTYDSNGNLATGPGAYSYDAINRLVSGTVSGTTMTLAYDGWNRCASRTVGSATTYYIYDGWNLIGEYIGTATTPDQTYVHGVMTDELTVKKDSAGTTVYYCADALGSVSYLTDSSGNIAEHYTYDIYGAATIYNASGTVISSSAYANRFMFTGREFLSQINVYDYRNRMYSADLGRFLQTDPIRENGGINWYTYGTNNPTNLTDPTGLLTFSFGVSWSFQMGFFSAAGGGFGFGWAY